MVLWNLGENIENVLLKGIDFYRDIDNMTITGWPHILHRSITRRIPASLSGATKASISVSESLRISWDRKPGENSSWGAAGGALTCGLSYHSRVLEQLGHTVTPVHCKPGRNSLAPRRTQRDSDYTIVTVILTIQGDSPWLQSLGIRTFQYG